MSAAGGSAVMEQGPIVLYDGVCNFCDATVRFLIDRDPRASLRFAALQSGAARGVLERFPSAPLDLDTIVLIESGRLFSRSSAALRIARRLRMPWPLLYGLIVVPRPLRDAVYGWFARHRYRWFGKREECRLPGPDERTRFL